ncbi:transposase [Stagnihabitans tardus]|uniref:Transposase InsH N-terminal domain-containing protein n=1 Tax=Stagnihabitans tardus TaxID=2699202 RepID=A0AAE4YCE1_9RHOB|nr:transposase [Stagnihabitans tardus]NBZ87629.1 hypothetical protein [Stagnihabitans tardus]
MMQAHARARLLAVNKPLDAVATFKTLVLCMLFSFSDGQIEYQVHVRLSFMQFLGLELAD